MIKKIFQFLKSCFSFWKNFATSKNKKEFLSEKAGELKTQIIILLLSAFSVFVVYNSLKPAVRGVCRIILQSEEDENDGMDDRVAGIEAEKVKAGTTLRQIKSIGILKGNAEVVIKSEIPGKIQGIQFTEGSHVEKNQELIVFEDDLYKANKARAEAECELAKGDFERQKKLFQGKAGSQKIYEEALAKMNSAKAELDKAAYELSRTRIKAPFSGTVGIMKISAGNIVEQHRDLVNLVDNSLVKVEFWIPAKYIEDIAVGQNVEIVVGAFKEKVFSGTVDAIDAEIEEKSHSILVRAVIPNKNGNLRHGMHADVRLITGEKGGVLLVSEDAVDREGSLEFVWTIDEKGRSYKKRVLTGSKDTNGVEILAGLREGEIVVIAGQLKLSEGAKTKILNKIEEEEKEPSEKEDASEKSEKNKAIKLPSELKSELKIEDEEDDDDSDDDDNSESEKDDDEEEVD